MDQLESEDDNPWSEEEEQRGEKEKKKKEKGELGPEEEFMYGKGKNINTQ